jgi:hypothetical protein
VSTTRSIIYVGRGSSIEDAPATWEYSVTLSPSASATSPARVFLKTRDSYVAETFSAWLFDLKVRAPAPTVDLGLLADPSKDFLEEAKKAGHLTENGELTLAPGQTLKFRVAVPLDGRSESSVILNAEPPSAVTWTKTPTTLPGDAPGMEYTVTLATNASPATPVRIQLTGIPGSAEASVWSVDMPVQLLNTGDGREKPSTVRAILDAIASPFERIASAIARTIRGTSETPRADEIRRDDAPPTSLVGADGQPLPDDLAKAIRARGARGSEPTPGLSGVLNERITRDTHPEREVGE